MSDQHRYDYMGCAGADFMGHAAYRRARIQRDAVHSVRGELTALRAVTHCLGERFYKPFREQKFSNRFELSLDVPTHYQHMRNHGYRTACVGKLDLAKPQGYNGRRGTRPPDVRVGIHRSARSRRQDARWTRRDAARPLRALVAAARGVPGIQRRLH